MPDHVENRVEGDPLADIGSHVGVHTQLSGCYTILPLVQICYDWNGSQVQACLEVSGIKITCITLDASNPGATLSANLLLVKASVGLNFDVANLCLTYNATGCYRATPWSDWECESATGTIVCF